MLFERDEILQRKDSEEEILSKTEGHEEHSNHNSDTEQEVELDGVFDIPLQYEVNEEPILPVPLEQDYLDDVPLKYIRSKWKSSVAYSTMAINCTYKVS